MRNWNVNLNLPELLLIFVFSLPMRNWNPNSSNIDSTSFAFSAYLWGIETPFLNLNMCSVRVFSLPMRNWNPSSSFACSTGIAVFSLPMRNWNVAPAAPAWTGSLVFSLPMRNWNCLKRIFQPFLEHYNNNKNQSWILSDVAETDSFHTEIPTGRFFAAD